MKKTFLLLWAVCFFIFTGSVKDVFCLDWPPEVDIIEISFNYDSGSTTYDAVTLKANASSYKPVPEWKQGVRNHKVAYIQNQSNRKIKTKFQLDRSGDYIMGVYAEEYQANYGIGDVNETEVSFDGSDKSIPKVMTCDGTIPSGVQKNYRYNYWHWYVTYICDDDVEPEEFDEPIYIGITGPHNYYTLLGAPQSPMTEPWTEVLDYACQWAGGKTSSSGSANEITNDLYSSGFKYETSNGSPRYGSYSVFKLTQFLSELGSSFSVNCLDMAKAVKTFGNAIGCNLILNTFGYDGIFPLNCIDPIGSASPTNNTFRSTLIDDDYRTGGFSYHAIAENSAESHVWDATLKYDIDSNPDNVSGSNPGPGAVTSGYSWDLPDNVSESTYMNRLIDDWTKNHNYSINWIRDRSFSIQ